SYCAGAVEDDHRLGGVLNCHRAGDLHRVVAVAVTDIVSHVVGPRHVHVHIGAAEDLTGQVAGTPVIGCGACIGITGVALDDNAGRAIKSDHRFGRVADCYGAGDLDGSVAAGIRGIVRH